MLILATPKHLGFAPIYPSQLCADELEAAAVLRYKDVEDPTGSTSSM